MGKEIKVSDYIANFLVHNGITTVFTVVGGGSMHLNDSFGHNKELKCVYQHHEQACSMAAEGFSKANQGIAAVCVTSGPGAINALNGVVGAYQDSVPMIVLSGQVKSTLTVKSSGLNLRTLGGQEFDIVSALSNMTKYAEMINDPKKTRYCLEKALYFAKNGRPGPCWLDIPLDIQGAKVDENELEGYDVTNNPSNKDLLSNNELNKRIGDVVTRLKMSERPVLYVGNGIRIANALREFNVIVEKLNIPVVTCWDSIDLIETDNEHYAGRGGTMGDRAGNFAIQNSDMVLAIGNRLSILQVGYDVNTWAREAYVIDVDIDVEELKKPTIRVDLPICTDAKLFLNTLINNINEIDKRKYTPWINRCLEWKKRYPVVELRHIKQTDKVNVYAFIDVLSKKCGENSITVATNGSASVVGSQAYHISYNQRYIMNCALSSMGYGLPSAIGASVANNKGSIICLEGDGSIQMNIQELQTIVTNKLPIKIFIINNDGYHQIRQTQNNIFHNGLVGVGPESGDLGFPNFEKIAYAYGIPYERIDDNSQLEKKIDIVLGHESYIMCEVICSTTQNFEPKSSTKKLEDGTLISPPLEDMAPFLSREELRENMYIEIIEE